MMTETRLSELMRSSETHWVERKTSFNPGDIKKILVAFANSLPEGQEAVLFIGIGPNLKSVPGLNVDKKQRDIRAFAQTDCFPPIECVPTIVRDNGNEVIAVVVGFSPRKPHFTGHAFVRVGSETLRADDNALDELIASRNDKVRRLLRDKGQEVTVINHSYVNDHSGRCNSRDRITEKHETRKSIRMRRPNMRCLRAPCTRCHD
jgi:predicted HTH transcriptional regulator